VIVPLEGVAASAVLHLNASEAIRPPIRTRIGILTIVDRLTIGGTRG